MNKLLMCLLALAASEDYDSSKGTAASGLQTLSKQVVELSTQIEATSKALSSVLDSQLTVTEDTASAELAIEIEQVTEDLDEVTAEIEELETELDSRQSHCPYLESCSKCVSNYSCVWCSSLNKCLAGDSQGPYGGECTSYQYSKCNSEGCSRYTECGSCINDAACGWCINGQYCLAGSPSNTGDCYYDFFYSAASGTNNECPADSSAISKDNTTYRTRTADEDAMLERLDELHIEKIKIEQALEDLDEMVDQVHELADDARGLDYGHSTVFYDLDSLAKEAHELYEEEQTEFRDIIAEESDEAIETKVTTIEDSIQQETVDVSEAQTSTYNDLDGEINSYNQTMMNLLKDTLDEETVNKDYEPTLTEKVEENNQKLDTMSQSLTDSGYPASTTSTFLQVKSRLFRRRDRSVY